MEDATFLLTIGSFLLTVELFHLQLTILAFLLIIGAFSLIILVFYLQLEFFAYSGKVLLTSAFRDCKQRSLAVSENAPTVSNKTPTERKIASPLLGPPAKHRRQGDEKGRRCWRDGPGVQMCMYIYI